MHIGPTPVLLINIINGKMRQTMRGFGFQSRVVFLHSDLILPPVTLHRYMKNSLSTLPQILI